MYIHNLNPTLFELGPLEIRYYGIVYALGFLLVYYLIYKKKESLEIKGEQIDNLMLSLLIGLLVGARIFHFLFSEPYIFLKKPLELFMIQNGGMSFFGALVGCFLASFWYLKRIKLDWKKFADIIVVATTIALIFGRIANFINGELIGVVSNLNLPWLVNFNNEIDEIGKLVFRHPYQIYASISHLFLLGLLLFVNKIKNRKNGIVFAVFVVGYSILRFLTDFLREENIRFIGLTVWQYVSTVVFVIGVIWMIKEKVYKVNKKVD
jgi:phosphatidylglycerol---prolipoprotein diacylglyceryl transferase